MSRLRALAQNLATAAVALLLVLLLLEGAARWRVRAWMSHANPIRTPFARYDPLLGWSKPPGADGFLVRPEYRVRLRINSQGLRGPERPYQKPAGVRRVLLLGDSFTEGYTVEEELSVRARLEAALLASGCAGSEVLNGGTAAWGTDQEYLFYHYEGRRYAPDVAGKPWFDLEGDADRLVLRDSPVPEPRRPPESNAFRLVPWRGSLALRLLSQRTRARPELHARLAALGLVEPLPDADHDVPAELNPFGPRNPAEVRRLWRVTAALLRELDRELQAQGARLVVFYVPARFEVCGRLGLTLVDPRGAMRQAEQAGRRCYLPLDGHWTALGHELAAQALLEKVRACPAS